MGPIIAFLVVFFIALLPGFMNAFVLAAYLIDKRPKSKDVTHWPDISVLIPCLNEEKDIANTVTSIALQEYPGKIQMIVIDNGSKDDTVKILKSLTFPNLLLLEEKNKGKSYALNKGLAAAIYDYIMTVDADTYLLTDAVKKLVIRLLSVPTNTVAVAGSIYVKNSRESFITRLQEWDYFHSIAIIKRMQSLFQGTLVAQGSFSIYKKNCVLEVGAWPHQVGEDIVLTWALLEKGYRIDFSEEAIAFTTVPSTYKAFFAQRSRWARGMLEAFVTHPKVLLVAKYPTFFIYWDLFFPVIDTTYFFIFIPGVIMALFGYYFIAGPMTLAVLPIALVLNMIWFYGQRDMFAQHHLSVRKNKLGFVFYFLFYYLLMVPACIYGYLSEIFNIKKVWGTK